MPDATIFRSAREFAAWLGRRPKRSSTAGNGRARSDYETGRFLSQVLARHRNTQGRSVSKVLSRIFRTFDQATAPVSESCG
ncbi:hypothetical protein [Bradyrhizobium yuanmingense]|uniref:hypothetical protein n=1 Tax=Bradyrhizobium yuanmingense TaxID=108015 RepID=UPI001FCE9AA7|nr:hypothetical protein [Bradyrhizobium yuanmingense]